jgi:hypothetical protein
MTSGIRGYRAISEVTGLMPLVVIPYIEAPFELAERLVKQTKMKKIMIYAGVTLILLTTIVIYIYSIPLAETFLRSN